MATKKAKLNPEYSAKLESALEALAEMYPASSKHTSKAKTGRIIAATLATIRRNKAGRC